MQYGYGVAKDLYEANQHPRLLCGPQDIERIKGEITSGHGKTMLDGMYERIKGSIAAINNCDDVTQMQIDGKSGFTSDGAKASWVIQDIALYAVLTEDADAIAAAKAFVTAAPKTRQADGAEQFRKLVGVSNGGHLAFAYDLIAPYLSDEEQNEFCEWAAYIAKRIHDEKCPVHYVGAGANITIHCVVAATKLLLATQGHPASDAMQDELSSLLRMLEASFYNCVGRDGWPVEDIGYGPLTTARLIEAGEAVRRAGLIDIYTRHPHLLKFGRAILANLQPWGKDLTNIGDHGDDFGFREFILMRLAEETNDPALLWLTGTLHYTHGVVHPSNAKPEIDCETIFTDTFKLQASFRSFMMLHMVNPPKREVLDKVPTQYRDRTRGLVFFRSGWQDDNDTYITFDGCRRPQAAPGHQHASGGHFCLSAVGEYFSIDTGRYNGAQDCHSIVIINGEDGQKLGNEWKHCSYPTQLINYQPGEIVDTASADTAHQHNCYHAQRHLFLIKGEGTRAYAITVDNINANDDWNEFWWQMQTSPENTIELGKTSATITGWQQGNKLDVEVMVGPLAVDTRPTSIAMEQDTAIYSAHNYYERTPEELSAQYNRPSDMVHGPTYMRPRLLGKVTAPCGDIMAVMTPRLKDEPAAKVTQFETVPGSIGAIIEHEKVTDTFIYAYEHGILEGNGITARGRWCLVRRDNASGEIIHQELGDGDWIKVSDK
jgi:hypothetical protein